MLVSNMRVSSSLHNDCVKLLEQERLDSIPFLFFPFRWFPQTERSRAVGISMAGFQLGCAIGLTLSPILMSQGGIFSPFVIFGLSGFLWVLVWLSATSSTPDQSPQISKYELEYILNKRQKPFSVETAKPKKVKVVPPFRRLLSKMPTWSLIIANAMHSWVMLHIHSIYSFLIASVLNWSWRADHYHSCNLVCKIAICYVPTSLTYLHCMR